MKEPKEKEKEKEAFIEGYKQRAESSNLKYDNISRMYSISLYEKWTKGQSVKEHLKQI